MKIAVTGGTGFIGYRLAQLALERGWEVRLGGRPGSVPEAESFRLRELGEAGVTPVAIDLADRDSLRRFFAGCDLVVHLAAAQHEANVPDQYFTDINVDGTRAVIECAVAEGVARLVHGSTIGVYGQGSPKILTEDSPTATDNAYGRTKKRGEEVVTELGDRIDATILRIGETYGPGDFRLIKLFRGIAGGRFPLIGRCANLHQPIYVDDLVEMIFRSARMPEAVGQTLIAAGPEPVSTRGMAESVATALGTPLRARQVPMGPVLAVACAMEWTLGPLGIQPPLHRRRLDFYRKNLVFDIDRLQSTLDYRPPTDFATGAKKVLGWYREKGLVPQG